MMLIMILVSLVAAALSVNDYGVPAESNQTFPITNMIQVNLDEMISLHDNVNVHREQAKEKGSEQGKIMSMDVSYAVIASIGVLLMLIGFRNKKVQAYIRKYFA